MEKYEEVLPFSFSRLSLKYEPSQTPELKKRHTEHRITPLSSKSTSTLLRTSKSYEDLLTQLSSEGLADTEPESPFSVNQRHLFMRRSLNTRSRTVHEYNSPAIDVSVVKQAGNKLSVPAPKPVGERLGSASVEVVRKTTTLPVSFKDTKVLSPSAGGDWTKPRAASDYGKRRHLQSEGTSPPSGRQKPFPPSPSTQPRAKAEGRSHKKSHSMGSK